MPTVIGGGIAGLSAAYYLVKRFVNPVKLYEGSNRFGGWIRSERHEHKGFTFEFGPRTIRPKGPAAPTTLELIDDLGLGKIIHPIYATHPAATKRMIYVKNNLHILPTKFSDIFRKIPPFTKPLINGIFNDIKAPAEKQLNGDETIYDFVERRFGSEIAEYAISAMICGICAGDAKEISVRFLLNDIFELEQQYGGVIKGLFLNKLYGESKINNKHSIAKLAENSKSAQKAKNENWSIYTLKGGMEMLPKRIVEYLRINSVELNLNSECKKIMFHDDRVCYLVNGKEQTTDHIVSALPSYKLAKLIDWQHPSLGCLLKSIPYVDVAIVNLQYNTMGLLTENAFGFLVPPIERSPILGIIFDSCCFDMHGNTVLTVMMGGRWFQDRLGIKPTTKDILDLAKEQVRKILKINEQPSHMRVNILEKCIPQYTVGHKVRLESIRAYIKKYELPLSVCGAAYDGVGVNDVILSAKSQVYKLLG